MICVGKNILYIIVKNPPTHQERAIYTYINITDLIKLSEAGVNINLTSLNSDTSDRDTILVTYRIS